jgi:hypothetical protein
MKTSVALLCMASGLLLPGLVPANAASPAYCALYAREYAAARVTTVSGDDSAGALQRVEDQAYYRCLNLDEEPEFPATSAYFGQAVEEMDGGIGGPFEDLAEGDAAGDIPDEPVDQPAVDPAPVKPKPAKVASSSKGKTPAGSGLTPWTDEWATWCKAHYRSFNATTGMVVTLSGARILCP